MPVSYVSMNGAWLKLKRGLVVVTPAGEPTAYPVCGPSGYRC
jgi:hypothetical protein